MAFILISTFSNIFDETSGKKVPLLVNTCHCVSEAEGSICNPLSNLFFIICKIYLCFIQR